MASDRNAVKLGTTLIIVFVLFLAIMLWLPQTWFSGAKKKLHVRFSQSLPLPTLQEGSKVLVAGRPVGQVTEVELRRMKIHPKDPSPGEEQYLIVNAKSDKVLPFYKDCKIRAVGEVLGGNGSVSIDLGTSDEPADLNAILEGSPPGGFSAYLDTVGK